MIRKYLEVIWGMSPKHMFELALVLIFAGTLWAGGLQGVLILVLFILGGLLLSVALYRILQDWWEHF